MLEREVYVRVGLTFGNICLSIKCLLRFCGAEHLRSQPSTKQAYYSKQYKLAIDLAHPTNPPKHTTYSLLPLLPPRLQKRIMILLDMQVQEMRRRKVLPAFRTAVHVGFGVVDLVFFICSEGGGFFVRWEGASHYLNGLKRGCFQGEMGIFCELTGFLRRWSEDLGGMGRAAEV
jgi:hypothetical protein